MLELLIQLWPMLVVIVGLIAMFAVMKYKVDKQDEVMTGLLKALKDHKEENKKEFKEIHNRCYRREGTLNNTLKDLELEITRVNSKLDNLQRIVDASNLPTLGTQIDNLNSSIEDIKKWFEKLEARQEKLETIMRD